MNQGMIIGGVFILIAIIVLTGLILHTRGTVNEIEEKVDRNTGGRARQKEMQTDLDAVWSKMEGVIDWIGDADPVIYG